VAFCSNCGRELSPAAQACPQCGTPTNTATATITEAVPVQAGGRQLEGLAVASLISSIASFFVLPLIGSILGIVFGNISLGRIRENPGLRGTEIARAGIVVGWIGIVLFVLAMLFIVVFLNLIVHAFD